MIEGITVADARRIARAIDHPESEPERLLARAVHSTRNHLGSAPLGASLRGQAWSDTDVREAVSRVQLAHRALRGHMLNDQPSPYSDIDDVPIPYRLTERVYLASALPNRGRVLSLAAQLARDGVEVVSTWHDRDDATVAREAELSRHELGELAEACLAEIDTASTVVWMHGYAEGRVGAAVEVGYALARGKRLLTLSLDGAPAPSVFGALGAAVTISGLYRAVGGA